MYKDNNTMFSRERISDEMLRRMLDGNASPMTPPTTSTAKQTWGLEGYPLASVYAPLQGFQKLYDKETALAKGTLFSELDLPFMGENIADKGGLCRG